MRRANGRDASHPMQIRHRFLLMGLPGLIVPLAGLAASALWLQWSADETAAARLAVMQTRALAQGVSSALARAEEDLERMVASEPALADLATQGPPAAAALEALLKRLARAWPAYGELRIAPPPALPNPAPVSPRERPAWMLELDASRTNQVLPAGTFSPAAPGPVLAHRIAPQGPWLLAAVPVAVIDGEVGSQPALERPLLWLLDNERRILAASHAAHVPWSLAPAELDALLAAGAAGQIHRQRVEDLDLGGLAQALPGGLTAVVLVPRAEVFFASRWLLAGLGGAFGAGLLLWFLHGLLAQRLLVRPIEDLTEAAKAFVRNDAGSGLPVSHQSVEIAALAKTLEDVRRHLRESTAEAHRLINADALTGLPNRRYIMQRLAAEIARLERRAEGCFAVMFIDLDNFKSINDSMGHKAGDRLVVKVAQRLVQAIRAYDSVVPPDLEQAESDTPTSLVARLGGDEFLLVLNDLKQPEDAARIAQRLYAAFDEPVGIDTLQVYVSMSIGIVLHPGSGDTAEQLIKNADVAMYAAKGAGKNQFRFYEASMERSARRTLEIENAIRQALTGQGLSLSFQPLFSLPDRQFRGAEVLVRWQDAALGTLSPAEFIPVAEACGLIHELGNWVLLEALTQLRDWKRAGLDVGRLSINLSTHQVESEGLADRVLSLISRMELAPQDIEFELTETAVFRHRAVAVRNLIALREAGVRFALDDFGTGYSSLSWVQHFTVDAVKIDRSFVQAIGTQDRHRAVVASVVELCRRLALDVVAEGVESEEQAEALCMLGCTHAQGFYLSHPLAPESLAAFVRGFAVGHAGIEVSEPAHRRTG